MTPEKALLEALLEAPTGHIDRITKGTSIYTGLTFVTIVFAGDSPPLVDDQRVKVVPITETGIDDDS